MARREKGVLSKITVIALPGYRETIHSQEQEQRTKKQKGALLLG